jgi:hypothetical protein
VTTHRKSLSSARGPGAVDEERIGLAIAFRAAGLDVDDLDTARAVLLGRLSRRSDDFAATAALQALNTFSARQRSDGQLDAPRHLRDAGLSSIERMRHPTPVGGPA